MRVMTRETQNANSTTKRNDSLRWGCDLETFENKFTKTDYMRMPSTVAQPSTSVIFTDCPWSLLTHRTYTKGADNGAESERAQPMQPARCAPLTCE